MDRSNDIFSRGINSANNFLNRLQEEEWNEDTKKTFMTASKIILKIGFFIFREISYFFTGVLTFPKKRCVIEGEEDFVRLKKLMKTVLPIIFGISVFFYSSIATPFLLTIAMPSVMFYSTLMICKGVIKAADYIMDW